MNVVDSSGWIEYFTASGNADFFASAVEDVAKLVVPSITLYEVFKWVLSHWNEDSAIRAVAHMRQGRVVDLDSGLAVRAAHLRVSKKIPMADSIILATARQNEAVVWTQDSDFEGLDGVHFIEKRPLT